MTVVLPTLFLTNRTRAVGVVLPAHLLTDRTNAVRSMLPTPHLAYGTDAGDAVISTELVFMCHVSVICARSPQDRHYSGWLQIVGLKERLAQGSSSEKTLGQLLGLSITELWGLGTK